MNNNKKETKEFNCADKDMGLRKCPVQCNYCKKRK